MTTKRVSIKLVCTLSMLLVLVGRCHHNNTCTPTTKLPKKQKPPAQTAGGIWHSGSPSHDATFNITRIASPDGIDDKVPPELSQFTGKKYEVKHNGSCGFRCVIPTMLQMLPDDRWQSWIEDIHKTVFERAQAIVQAHTYTRYNDLAPTDNPEALYQKTRSLLATLNKEKTPRQLREEEILTLVAFLRQTVLMQKVIEANTCGIKNVIALNFKVPPRLGESKRVYARNNFSKIIQDTISDSLEKFYKDYNACRYGKEWWTDIDSLAALKLPLIFISSFGTDPVQHYWRVPRGYDLKALLERNKVVINHHDDMYFDYYILKQLTQES